MSRRGWLLFSAMCVIWGIPYLLIKVAVDELAPSTLVLGRTLLGAALLLPIAFLRKEIGPLFVRWLPLVIYTLVEICGPWLLLGYAEQRLTSSLTGLLIASVPLIGAVIARFGADHEPLGRRRLAGLLLGLAGVAALVGFELGGGDVGAIVAVAFVAVGYAVGPMMLARYLNDLPQLGVVAGSLALAALLYLPAGIAQAPHEWPSGKAIAAVVALAVVCTALAFVVFLKLIAEVGPARSTVITYVNPAVAVLLGVAILDERFTWSTALGFVLILGGSVLATARTKDPAAAPAGPAGGADGARGTLTRT